MVALGHRLELPTNWQPEAGNLPLGRLCHHSSADRNNMEAREPIAHKGTVQWVAARGVTA